MPFGAPAPGFGAAGFAENRPVVELGVAGPGNLPPFGFQGAEDVLVFNDEAGLAVGVLGEAGGEEFQGEAALAVVHIAQGQAVAVEGRVVPENALAIQVVVGGFAALGGVQAGEPAAGGVHHSGGDTGVGVGVATRGHRGGPPV